MSDLSSVEGSLPARDEKVGLATSTTHPEETTITYPTRCFDEGRAKSQSHSLERLSSAQAKRPRVRVLTKLIVLVSLKE